MCGIVGVLNFHNETISPVLLREMTDSIAHRGPDGEGFYIDGPVGLAHRRLAILDLSPTGHQPMMSADERYVLSYNGEIYNYQELRASLQAQGFQFRGSSDAEVVLYAYAYWGQACVERFNGMFAFAIYDKQERTVFLARDRYGIKPLYYALSGHHVVFASEQRAIMCHPNIGRDIDQAALLEYFTFQNILTNRTLYKNVQLMRAGCYALIDLKKARPEQLPEERYWDFNFVEPEEAASVEEYEEELQRLFAQAVNRQLVSDVEVGSYLSGGMDSGSISMVASRHLPYIKTFTCGFDLSSASGLELGYDERRAAEHMSYLCKSEHYEMVLKAGDMERVMQPLVYHLEEPRVGQSYPNFYVAKLASKFVKVVLSGAGGDELFAGYPWRYYRAVVNDSFESYVDKYYDFWQRLIPHRAMSDVFAPIWNDVSDVDTRAIFREQFAHHADELTRPEDYINHSLYFEAKTFLHGLLVIEDKISMAHSLETRVPFLDNDLVDFAMKVPVHMKLGNLGEVVRLNENEPGPKTAKYFGKTRDGKLLLRNAMRKFIPQEAVDRVKQGFSAPDKSWFQGESVDFVKRSLLEDPHAPLYQYMDYTTVSQLVQEHTTGQQNRRLLIWSLLNTAEWLRSAGR